LTRSQKRQSPTFSNPITGAAGVLQVRRRCIDSASEALTSMIAVSDVAPDVAPQTSERDAA